MIIGIMGKKEVGKTTLASMMADEIRERKQTVAVIAFADPLKEMIVRAGICSFPEMYEEKTEYSRKMMQLIGTNLFRVQIDPGFWIKKMAKDDVVAQMQEGKPPVDHVIIHDVRFPNEAQFVKDKGGIVIKVTRNNGNVDNHISETVSDDIPYDFWVVNNGPLDDLRADAYTIVNLCLKR